MALTKVILDGKLGSLFGKEWNLAVSTPSQALSLIEANKNGLFAWIKSNARKYANYRVTITGQDGKKLKLDSNTYAFAHGTPKMIRFTPVIQGAGAAAKIVVGAILLVVSYFFPALAPYLVPMGISLMIGGLVELLSPRPKKADSSSSDDGASYYFNGPVNTTAQGIPVPLVYGRCLVGSQAVSASITIDQLMTATTA